MEKILTKVCEFYHNSLNQNQKIKDQLYEKFKLTSQIIANNRLGFSDSSILKTIPPNGPIPESLKQAGVLNEYGKEVYLDCLIIPELDPSGSCLKLTGKKLSELSQSDISHLIPKEEPKPTVIESEQIEALKDGLFIRWGQRKYLIKGIDTSNHHLKVTIKALDETRFHIDSLDLYSAKSRKAFARETAILFHSDNDTAESDLNKIIERLEAHVASKKDAQPQGILINDKDKEEALVFLRSPDLIQKILADFEVVGCCGEKTNKLIGYLAAVSRKLDDPLSLLILSRSAAGKSTLQDAILELVPEEDKSKYTRITGQALFYKGENSLKHKLVAIEEEEGASSAAYSIRTMQSSKLLNIATTIKDPLTGQMKTVEYQVKGPLALFLTTTRTEIDYETMNRFIILTIDESRIQTQAIHKIQREADTLTGLMRDTKKDSVIKRHHNGQRLLRPLKVINPFAHLLTFADDRLRLRRDHKKYLGLIKAITFLHQYQRPIKQIEANGKVVDYIEVTLEDISFANIIAADIFGQSLDELAPASRRLLFLIGEMVKVRTEKQGIKPLQVKFTRRDLREYTRWSDNQVRDHLKQLIDLEYLAITAGSNGSRYFYELIYDGQGQSGEKFFMGLADSKTLRQGVLKQNSSYAKATEDKPVPQKGSLVPGLSGACPQLVGTGNSQKPR